MSVWYPRRGDPIAPIYGFNEDMDGTSPQLHRQYRTLLGGLRCLIPGADATKNSTPFPIIERFPLNKCVSRCLTANASKGVHLLPLQWSVALGGFPRNQAIISPKMTNLANRANVNAATQGRNNDDRDKVAWRDVFRIPPLIPQINVRKVVFQKRRR